MSDTLIMGAFFGFWLLVFAGWVLNVVKFFHALGDPITMVEIARGVGILVAPLGAVIGWF